MQWNISLCGFDVTTAGSNECLEQCANSGCSLSLLGNGKCDNQCRGAAYGLDMGDAETMLRNNVCDEPSAFAPLAAPLKHTVVPIQIQEKRSELEVMKSVAS